MVRQESLEVLQEGVELLLATDGSGLAVTGKHEGVVGEGQELVLDRAKDQTPITTGKVGAADAVAEECVTSDQLVLLGDPQTDAALGMPRGVQHVEVGFAQA